MSASKPLIGLTTYRQQVKSGVWDVPASFLPGSYIEGVTRAGGLAVLLPPQPVGLGVAEAILAGLDALIITGGRDLDPAAYGHDPHPATDEPARDRDAWELALLDAALRFEIPVLGICRGAQVLNVALGGTLHQHLPEVVGHTRHQKGQGMFSTSTVRTVDGSIVARLIGPDATVQCYHHQSIDRLGAGLVVSATDEEGIIEAVELPGDGFVVAVQWHPEENLEDLRLFVGLVEAARTFPTGAKS